MDALAYKVSPGRIVDDRKQRVRSALTNVKDKVMGTASDLGHSTGHAAHSVGDHASSAASTVGDKAHSAASTVGEAAQRAPQVVRQKSQGNPIAAGVIAFGVGMLGLLADPGHPPRAGARRAGQGEGDRAQRHGQGEARARSPAS